MGDTKLRNKSKKTKMKFGNKSSTNRISNTKNAQQIKKKMKFKKLSLINETIQLFIAISDLY